MSPASFIDDPHWADFLPEMSGEALPRHLPAHGDCSSLDPDAAAAHLGPGGVLGAMPGYEERPGQVEMLRAIVRAFNGREHLMVEAGTGVGKSLAYLVPAVLWAWTNDTPVVVATATRNLQSQLMASDIPRARSVLGEYAPRLRVALLKGRANYVCLRAVGDFFASGYWTMSAEERAAMPRFIDWLRTTPDGDLDCYDGLPRALLTCPAEECASRRCAFYTRCFLFRARRAAAEAHLVVANHALVLADATMPGGGVLPVCGRLVLDEAHNLEDSATGYLSREFSLSALARVLNRLRRRGAGRRAGGVLASVKRQLDKGVLARSPLVPRITKALDEIVDQGAKATRAAEKVVEVCAKLLKVEGASDRVRYRTCAPEAPSEVVVREHSVGGLFRAYPVSVWSEKRLAGARALLERALADLVQELHGLAEALEESSPAGEFNFCADLASQVSGVADLLVAFANDAQFVLDGEKPTHAYWVERVRVEGRADFLRLVAAPLSVADSLRGLVWKLKDSVVLASATLRVGNDFTFMARRLGFFRTDEEEADRYRRLTAPSPFDYLRQALVLAPDYLPDPAAAAAAYRAALADLLQGLVRTSGGRALVLFTSYEMMNAVAASVREGLAAAGFALYVQGGGASREAMTEALRSDARTVLFGAQSFWEGVDVAGEALSCVVLARLPFALRTDPVVEARSEQIDRAGGSSFRDYYLPEAVLKFRQGFGRLIRSRRDRGVVVVADPRVITKSYGGVFRRSLPAAVRTVTSAEELLARAGAFFSSVAD